MKLLPNMSFYRGLWRFGHVLYSIIVFVGNIYVYFSRFIDRFIYSSTLEHEVQYISRHVELFNKTPHHIVVLLGNEVISYKDLANIIVWCIAAGFSFITLYDSEGCLKGNEDKLYLAVKVKSKISAASIKWGHKNLQNGIHWQNGYQNEAGFKPKTQVNILSLKDGKQALVNVTRSLCDSALDIKLKSSDISQALVDKMMCAETGVPDPDVALYFGEVCCTYGLLPWQIRITEFLRLPALCNVTVTEFVNVLKTYAKCVQRYGK